MSAVGRIHKTALIVAIVIALAMTLIPTRADAGYTAVFAGTVRSDGAPIADLRVRIWRKGVDNPDAVRYASTRTAADGSWRVDTWAAQDGELMWVEYDGRDQVAPCPQPGFLGSAGVVATLAEATAFDPALAPHRGLDADLASGDTDCAAEPEPEPEPEPEVRSVLDARSVPAPAGADSTVTFRLSSADGAPISGASLALDRGGADGWRHVGDRITDARGEVTLEIPVARTKIANRTRARFAGDDMHHPVLVRHTVMIVKRDGRLTLRGPRKVVDGRRITLLATRSAGGETVAGPIRLQVREGRAWETVRTRPAGPDGVARFEVRPRRDSRWRAVGAGTSWLRPVRSTVHRVDNRPPGDPVRLPAGAPEPRVDLPDQRRAVGKGAHPVVTTIPDRVWQQMTGRSWHPGCPVGRGGLRLLRINYWDYDGYRRRGEIVAATGAIDAMASGLRAMYRADLPIRHMYRVDRFGWSGRLQGADDYRSMAAGNTSAFNCRNVVGRPGVRSPHATGRSLDINPWENPYRSPRGTYPNTWWSGRTHPQVSWNSSAHVVVRTLRAHGLRWTYGGSDRHHFDVGYGAGRVVVPQGCAAVSCH